jgi:hydroxyacid-oxoacid transhydrogenase
VKRAGIEPVIYDAVAVEPTDESFIDAARFVTGNDNISGLVSIGGGSVMDTGKAANLFSEFPDADFFDFVNAPIGRARDIPRPLKYHLAMPSTAGTGSEATGLAIMDIKSLGAKTGIGHRRLIPSLAVIDPEITFTMPSQISACTGWDVVSHAIESYTAKPFTARPRLPEGSVQRSLHQGANCFSDFGCIETLRIAGLNFARAVNDVEDTDARTYMAYAATLAGVAMGNAGTALPQCV